jgi:surface polysaccharide O-acyltransferase-like enzyme
MAMFFIVVYHCLTHCVGYDYGFNIDHPASLFNYILSDVLLVFSSISVNLYVMVSGYFLADIRFKIGRIVRTWLNACFYSFVITIVFMALSLTPWNLITLGKSVLPLATDAYWFVTQYIGLLILSPFLVIIIRHLSFRQYIALLIVGAFLCLSIIPEFPFGKRFYVAHGNSVWCFAYLFMFAGFIRHYSGDFSKRKLLFFIVLVVMLTAVSEMYMGCKGDIAHLFWFDYNGLPFILSIVMFIFIRQVNIPSSMLWNIMVKVAPYTFGIYLIHLCIVRLLNINPDFVTFYHRQNCIVAIILWFVSSLIVFLLSYALTRIIKKIPFVRAIV